MRYEHLGQVRANACWAEMFKINICGYLLWVKSLQLNVCTYIMVLKQHHGVGVEKRDEKKEKCGRIFCRR